MIGKQTRGGIGGGVQGGANGGGGSRRGLGGGGVREGRLGGGAKGCWPKAPGGGGGGRGSWRPGTRGVAPPPPGETDRQCGKNCKIEAMHCTVRPECISILDARPGSTARRTPCRRQDDKHIMSDGVKSDNHLPPGYQSDYSQ